MKLFAKDLRFFPDPAEAIADGLVLISDEMSTEILLEAYSFGIFPWPHEDYPVLWFSPDPRGILNFSELHISTSLKKFLKKNPYRLSVNQAFSEVIRECADMQRPSEEGTWINEHMINSYIQFHQDGYAHSVECWLGDRLVGGVYGVYVAGVFAGESMFFKESNASKVALLYLIDLLKKNGIKWMDIQMVSDNLKKFGGKYISRKKFLDQLNRAKVTAKPIDFLQYKSP